MEEPVPPESSEELSSADFPRALEARRQQALDLLAAQRQQFQCVEAELAAHLTEVEQRLAAALETSDRQSADLQAADQQARAELDQFAQQLRQRAEELSRHQAELSADRAEIASRQAELHLAREQLAREHQDLAEQKRQEQAELDRRAAELQNAENKLKQSQRAFASLKEEQQNEMRQEQQEFVERNAKQQEQLDRRAAELVAAETKHKQTQQTQAADQEEHQSAVRQLAGRRERFEEGQLRLEKELEELEARREETRAQRRRIAQQLRVERTALIQEKELFDAEIERQRTAIVKDTDREQTQLSQERDAFQEETNRERQQMRRERDELEHQAAMLVEQRKAWEESRRQADKKSIDQSAELAAGQKEIDRWQSLAEQSQQQAEQSKQQTAEAGEKIATWQQKCESLSHELSKLKQHCELLTQDLALQREGEQASSDKLPKVETERDSLLVQVQELEGKLAAAEKLMANMPPAADAQRIDELQRRFEMAVDDVRQLKRRNSELEEEIADLQATASAAQQLKTRDSGAVVHDWETTKKRLLEELEEDATQTDSTGLGEDDRLSVEGTIRITDEVIAQRDQEIADLKQQLSLQTGQPTAADRHAASAAAEVEVLDRDEVIRQERERLAALQHEWQEKLRQAEVEISVQRAKIARQRTELEEKQRVLEAEKAMLAGQQTPGQPTAANAPKKPGQKWLSRLGLKETDKE
jgi:hypothetical protein